MKRLLALLFVVLFFAATLSAFGQDGFRIRRSNADQGFDGNFARTVVRTRTAPQSLLDGEASEIFRMSKAPPPPVRQELMLREPPPRVVPSIPVVPVSARRLTHHELTRLSQRDVVIVIDKSGSMNTRDCPADSASLGRVLPLLFGGPRAISGGSGLISRWEWLKNQALDLASQTSRVPSQQLSIVLFDSRDRVFPGASLRSIPAIFENNRPSGGTNVVGAMKRQIRDYFARRDAGGAKPLLLAVITDGAPDSPSSLRDLIEETTHKMQSPNEIVITFLQIGNDRDGHSLLKELDHGVRMRAASYDIVQTRSFHDLLREGLASSLVGAIGNSQQAFRAR